MARRPLGPLLVVPQFEDMIDAPETKISVPPEPVANQILQDPIFGHLSSMWNNIETSQELSLRHQTNEIALVQGAASAGIPVDVMRKTMERVADQFGEDLASRLLSRLQRPESMTASVLSGPPAPPPPPGGVSMGAGPDAPMTGEMGVGSEVRTSSMGVGTEGPGMRSMQVGTDTQMRDAQTGPDDVEMVATSGGRPPSPPGFGQRLVRQQGYSSSSSFFHIPTELVMPPPPPPPDGPRVPMFTGPTRRPPPDAPLAVTSGGRPPDPPGGGAAASASGYVVEPARMDTDLPVLYRMHSPEPQDPKSRLERRKVAWRKGAPSVVTDEHRNFVAGMAQTAKENSQMRRELEVGRKRMGAGQAVKAIIDQQQGLGDALTQLATPSVVLHNAQAPQDIVVPPSSQPPQPPGGGGGAVRGRDPAPRPAPAPAPAAASSDTIAPSMPPARAAKKPSQAPPPPGRYVRTPSPPPAAPSRGRAPPAPSRAPAAPSRALIDSDIEADRSRSASVRGRSISSIRGAPIPSRGSSAEPVPIVQARPVVRGIPVPAGVLPSRASSAEPVGARDSRDLLARSRSPRAEEMLAGLSPDDMQRVYWALSQYAEIQRGFHKKKGQASRMARHVDERLSSVER